MVQTNEGSSAAYLLVDVSDGEARMVAGRIGQIDGVTSVHAVQGPFDLIVKVIATSEDELTRGVLKHVHFVEGVTRVVPCPLKMPMDWPNRR